MRNFSPLNIIQFTTYPPIRRLPHPRLLLWIYSPVLLLLGVIAWVHQAYAIPFGFFFRDTTVTLQGHPLTGLSSNVGAILWIVTAGICFFSSQLLHRTQQRVLSLQASLFLGCSGLVTLILAVDDFFLLHDDLLPNLLRINEKAVLVFYMIICSVYGLRFRRQISQSHWGILLLSFVFFAASLAVDRYQSRWDSPWRIFFEDGFKALGIFSWSGYFIRICLSSFDFLNATPNPSAWPPTSAAEWRNTQKLNPENHHASEELKSQDYSNQASGERVER